MSGFTIRLMDENELSRHLKHVLVRLPNLKAVKLEGGKAFIELADIYTDTVVIEGENIKVYLRDGRDDREKLS